MERMKTEMFKTRNRMRPRSYFLFLSRLLCAFMFCNHSYAADVSFIIPPKVRNHFAVAARKNNCGLLLANLSLKRLIPSGGVDGFAYIGETLDLPHLLIAGGLSSEKTDDIVTLLDDIASHSADSLLKKVQGSIARSQIDRNFLLCIAGPSCKFSGSEAGLYSSMDINAFKMRRFAELGNVNTGWRRKIKENSKAIESSIIVLPFPKVTSDNDIIEWLSIYSHEFMHYHDKALIKEWLDANVSLGQKKQAQDDLFAKYSRKIQEQLFLDLDFYTVFLESRAYNVSSKIGAILLSGQPLLVAEYHANIRNRCWSFLKSIVTGEFLEKLNITPENVLEFWLDIEKTMELSIARSKKS